MVEVIDEMEYLRKMAGYYESLRERLNEELSYTEKLQHKLRDVKSTLIKAMKETGVESFEYNGRTYTLP